MRGSQSTPSRTSSATLLLPASWLLFLIATLCLKLRAVPKQELWTVTGAVLYLLFATCFQANSVTREPSLPLARSTSRWVIRALLFISFILSILLPWTWIASGADPARVKLLGPHLFVMMAQVLFEIWSYRPDVGTAIRVGIPVGFVAYRIWLLMQWTSAAWLTEDIPMAMLAISNLAFWAIILFYVLLIRVCPLYFTERSLTQSFSS